MRWVGRGWGGDAWQRENRVNYMAAAHPQGPYLTRYSRHRTIPAAAYSRSFRAGAYTYIYTHTRCFRPVVGLIYSDIVSANGNLSPENPPHIRSYTLYCCVQNAAAAVVLCPTLLHYYIDCSKQHRIELDSTDPVKITFSPKLRKSNKFLNIFFPMETIE